MTVILTDKELETHLKEMDIPEHRRTLTISNIGWMFRNLTIRNQSHPMLHSVLNTLKHKYRVQTKAPL